MIAPKNTEDSKHHFVINLPHKLKGTSEEIKTSILNSINKNYALDGEKLVKDCFFEKVGDYIISNFNSEDLLRITLTIDDWNRHYLGTGNIPLSKNGHSIKYYGLLIFESNEFRNLEPKSQWKEIIKSINDSGMPNYFLTQRVAAWVGDEYITHMPALNFLGRRGFSSGATELEGFKRKYPKLEETVKSYWKSEVCEKTIFPAIEQYFKISAQNKV